MEKKNFKVEGLNCQHCVANVQKALLNFSGVNNVKVFQDEKLVVIEADTMPAIDEMNEMLAETGHYKLVD